MDDIEVKERIAAWSDILSLLLLFFAIAVAQVDPRRRVWGYSPLRNIFIIFMVSINVLFSATRLIAEGVLVETGPREFLLASVVYCGRWIFLYFGISRYGSRSQKAFKVAVQIKELKTIRLGISSRIRNSDYEKTGSSPLRDALHRLPGNGTWRVARNMEWGPSPDSFDMRRGMTELVIRRGERAVSGKFFYWRGVEEEVRQFSVNDNGPSDGAYFVRLVEPQLHSTHLDEIGTYEYKKRLEVESIDKLYEKIYNLVLTCDSQSSRLLVDYTPFLTQFKGIEASTAQASRTGATLNTDLGKVARRVAADACYFVYQDDGVLRTDDHVKVINQCLENAASTYMGTDNQPPEVTRSHGSSLLKKMLDLITSVFRRPVGKDHSDDRDTESSAINTSVVNSDSNV